MEQLKSKYEIPHIGIIASLPTKFMKDITTNSVGKADPDKEMESRGHENPSETDSMWSDDEELQ